MKAIQYSIYKGKSGKWGAVQFNFQPPHFYCSTCRTKNFETFEPLCQCSNSKMIQREGAVFMEITSATAADKYDWENKIVIALSVDDLSKMIIGMTTGSETKILHDPGAGSEYKGKIRKNLNLVSPKGVLEGCMLSVTETDDTNTEATKKHTVPLSPDNLVVLTQLFRSAIVNCLAW
jgi:hypothetical protein